jgi:ubiquinone/menaquinone biosynthesis C-methylase UbiE
LWDKHAKVWHNYVGDEGDSNRRFNSDPFLWNFSGEIEGKTILDAGCGTGYLVRKLIAKKAQRVIGIDFSPEMIKIASEQTRAKYANNEIFEFHVDSCTTLSTIEDNSIDLIISNYVLMDLDDLEGAIKNFYRVLHEGGTVVIVILHPCFPLDRATLDKNGHVTFKWENSYFDNYQNIEEPWGNYTDIFISYHRPLSYYWKQFKKHGFTIEDFDEPVVTDPPPAEFGDRSLLKERMRPNSVIFLLEKE